MAKQIQFEMGSLLVLANKKNILRNVFAVMLDEILLLCL